MIPSNPACFPCVCSSVILRPDTSIGVLRQRLLKCLVDEIVSHLMFRNDITIGFNSLALVWSRWLGHDLLRDAVDRCLIILEPSVHFVVQIAIGAAVPRDLTDLQAVPKGAEPVSNDA